MPSSRVGRWTLGLSLVAFGGALLYREWTGEQITLLRYWPLVLVGLGLELLATQARHDRAPGTAARIGFSWWALLGLALLVATLPALGGDAGGWSCTNGTPSNALHTLPRQAVDVDWSGATSLEISVKFGAVTVRGAASDVSGSAAVEIVGHGPTASSARSAAEAASLSVERRGDRIVLLGTNESPGSGTAYAEVNVAVVLPDGLDLLVTDEFGAVEVADVPGAVEIDTRMGAVVATRTGPLTAESDHGSITVRTVNGPAALLDTYGSVSAAEVAGTLKVDSKHGAVDVRDPGSDIQITATYGRVSVRYARAPAAAGSVRSTYGNVSLENPSSSSYELDVASERTRITTNLTGVTVSEAGSGSALRTAVNGGGPLITVRSSYGRIDIRAY